MSERLEIRLKRPTNDPLKVAYLALYELLDDACPDGASNDPCRCDASIVHNQARVVLGLSEDWVNPATQHGDGPLKAGTEVRYVGSENARSGDRNG